jgi:hypothetical protein
MNIKKGDNVWDQDGFACHVLDIKGNTAHIEYIDGSVMGATHIPGVDDFWVDISTLEKWSNEDYQEYGF